MTNNKMMPAAALAFFTVVLVMAADKSAGMEAITVKDMQVKMFKAAWLMKCNLGPKVELPTDDQLKKAWEDGLKKSCPPDDKSKGSSSGSGSATAVAAGAEKPAPPVTGTDTGGEKKEADKPESDKPKAEEKPRAEVEEKPAAADKPKDKEETVEKPAPSKPKAEPKPAKSKPKAASKKMPEETEPSEEEEVASSTDEDEAEAPPAKKVAKPKPKPKAEPKPAKSKEPAKKEVSKDDSAEEDDTEAEEDEEWDGDDGRFVATKVNRGGQRLNPMNWSKNGRRAFKLEVLAPQAGVYTTPHDKVSSYVLPGGGLRLRLEANWRIIEPSIYAEGTVNPALIGDPHVPAGASGNALSRSISYSGTHPGSTGLRLGGTLKFRPLAWCDDGTDRISGLALGWDASIGGRTTGYSAQDVLERNMLPRVSRQFLGLRTGPRLMLDIWDWKPFGFGLLFGADLGLAERFQINVNDPTRINIKVGSLYQEANVSMHPALDFSAHMALVFWIPDGTWGPLDDWERPKNKPRPAATGKKKRSK